MSPSDMEAEISRLRLLLNTPELEDFAKAVPLEAAHQRERWGVDHDTGKEPQDWFWTLGYLGGKALQAHAAGNTEKAKHHTITAAALLANWHARIVASAPASSLPEIPGTPPETDYGKLARKFGRESALLSLQNGYECIESESLAALMSAIESLKLEREKWEGIARSGASYEEDARSRVASLERQLAAMTLERDDADTLLKAVGITRKPYHDLSATPSTGDGK